MNGLVRRGGRGTFPDGSGVLWSVAEGGRGRRWRAAVAREGSLQRVILVETGVDGRVTRLEVEDAAGLLTLHPDHAEAVLHGNVVTPSGIRHITLAWTPTHELLVAPVGFSAAHVAWRLSPTVGAGEQVGVEAVVVDADLEIRAERLRIERSTDGRWVVVTAAGGVAVEIDDDGLPAGLDAAETWPLED